MKRPRRNHSAKFKAMVALAAIRGEKTLVELSEQYKVHPNQIGQWRAELLERAAEVLERTNRHQPSLHDRSSGKTGHDRKGLDFGGVWPHGHSYVRPRCLSVPTASRFHRVVRARQGLDL